MYGAHYLDNSLPIFKRIHILKFTDLYELHILMQLYLFHHDLVPTPIRHLFVRNEQMHSYETRQRSNAHFPIAKFVISY